MGICGRNDVCTVMCLCMCMVGGGSFMLCGCGMWGEDGGLFKS
jgi:hypothetical protein